MTMEWKRLLSRKRLGSSEEPQSITARTDFQRDFDRVVFSSAFRRMQDQTQVFPLSKVDYVRTRLTHSLEASSIGRSLGTLVGEQIMARHGLHDLKRQTLVTLLLQRVWRMTLVTHHLVIRVKMRFAIGR